jgi:hypothetical protein
MHVQELRRQHCIAKSTAKVAFSPSLHTQHQHPHRTPAAMEYEQEDHASVKKEEEDDTFDIEMETAELACNHLQARIPGSTLRISGVHGAPKCGYCGKYLRCEQALCCTICDSTFCIMHKFKPSRHGNTKSLSSKRTTRPHLEKFIRKFEIARYIPRCNGRMEAGLEPDVELFIAWADGVWSGMSDEERSDVPQATMDLVRQKWDSQHFQELAAPKQPQLSDAPPQQPRHAAPARRVHAQPRQLPHRQRQQLQQQQQNPPPPPAQRQQHGQHPLPSFGQLALNQDNNMDFANTHLTSADHQQAAEDPRRLQHQYHNAEERDESGNGDY